MERVALVTGSLSRVADVGDAMERAGFLVIRSADRSVMNGTCSSIAPRSLGCFVQLPQDAPVGGSEPLERVARFLVDGLVARFDVARRVVPLLRPDACVVLVDGDVPDETTPDDPHARRDLLQVMARAISGGSVGGEVKAIVVGADRSAREIAQIALYRGEDRGWLQSRMAALSPDLSYADWKREAMCLAPGEK